MTVPGAGNLLALGTERSAQDAEERAERRRLEIAEQRSDLHPPEVRIQIWEKLHGLRLPSDPDHPIVDVVAVSTRLTVQEVQQEQVARAARVASIGNSLRTSFKSTPE